MHGLRALAFSGGLSVCLSGCGLIDANILDVPVHLQTQTYAHDFGTTMGTVPSIPCSAQLATCQAIDNQIKDAQVTGVCDGSVCYAQANLTLTYTVNLASDPAFQSSVNQKLIQGVRTIDLAYGMPKNTLTFDIPEMEVYVGPQNAQSRTDPGVLQIGTIGPIKRGTPFADGSQHLVVADPSAARTQLVADVMNPKVPFVFLLATSTSNPPKVKAGDPVPAGALQLDISPTITVGIPR